MKVLHVTPSFYPATYWGGPIFSTLGLCDALSKIDDVDLRVLTTDTSGPKSNDRLGDIEFPTKFPAGYDVYYCHKTFGSEFSIELYRQLSSMIKWADVVHLTYTYSPPTIPTLLLCRIFGRPVVWSPRGALQRWDGTRRPILKRVWEAVCNVLVSKKHTVLHVTSTKEEQASSKRIPKAITVNIPNGVLMPAPVMKRQWKPENILRLMYMGRLHPIKGIENLILAMSLNKADFKLHLSVYGEGESEYRQQLLQLVKEQGLVEQIDFIGHVTEEDKTKAFLNADVCVVPSFTENFGMVVAESLAYGVPVVASKRSPWQELEEKNCGLWVDNSPQTLAIAIKAISTRELEEMGLNGRRWMQDDYAWSQVASRMYSLYYKLVEVKRSAH